VGRNIFSSHTCPGRLKGLTLAITRRKNMRFVIIGGDAAGMSAASRAKRNMPDLDVTVLEQTRDVSYSA
jgi:hypothetical protein